MKLQYTQIAIIALYPFIGFPALIVAVTNWTRVVFGPGAALFVLAITVLNSFFGIQYETLLATSFNSLTATLVVVMTPIILSYLLIYQFNKAISFLGPAWLALLMSFIFSAVSSGWLTIDHLTSPEIRLAICMIAVLPSLFVARISSSKRAVNISTRTALICVALAVALILLLPKTPIDKVVFDESHGVWETTKSSFSPDNFGRNYNYTYSLLPEFLHANEIQTATFDVETEALPETTAAFFIKMPTNELSADFKKRLVGWVESGGRLIVVADHTDLYNSGQIINTLLQKFGLEIAYNGVFNRHGSMNVVSNTLGTRILGRIDDDAFDRHWQTGTSFTEVPANTLRLASYGMGFTQHGDYSRANRFGDFVPSLGLPYMNYTAVAAAPIKDGLVTVILDSTPWSNFSFFKKQYKDLLLDIIGVQPYKAHLSAIAYLVWLLLAVTVIYGFKPSVHGQCALVFLISAFFFCNLAITSPITHKQYLPSQTSPRASSENWLAAKLMLNIPDVRGKVLGRRE